MSVPYQNTISGLLTKRADLLGEAQALREKLATARNCIESIDQVLESLGYRESLDGMRPHGTRLLIFDRNELRRFLIDQLRNEQRPVTSREIAARIIVLDGKDMLDRKLLNDMVDRVGKSFRLLRRQGVVVGTLDKANLMHWSLAENTASKSAQAT